jgi:hypothetical protein
LTMELPDGMTLASIVELLKMESVLVGEARLVNNVPPLRGPISVRLTRAQ